VLVSHGYLKEADWLCRNGVTATFRELGPPDLCHVVKSNGRSGQRDVRPFSRLIALCYHM
jgi:hypothetical protein